jgi:dUTP pyrophosphatase
MNQESVTLRVKRLPHCHTLPKYASSGAAGMDLVAAIEDEMVLRPGDRVRMPIGIEVEIPPGFQGQVVPRSGLADRSGISLTNCVGTIDSDYRGEVQVLLINHGREPHTFKRGDRVAQLVIVPIPQVDLVEVDQLNESVRDRGGFGSTGNEWVSDYKGQR